MKNIFYYDTKIGRIGIAEDGKGITNIYMEDKLPSDGMHIKETELLKKAAKQINDYLDGKIESFDIPLSLKGTAFQRMVWEELQKIPYGETYCYKKVAEKIGKPTAARAVGMANNKNPILIVVPCHRVIGHDGKLVGYAAGLDIKEQLLKIEKSKNINL